MPDDHADIEVLTVVATEWEAELLVSALKDEGIAAEASGALTSGFRAEAPGGVKVLVNRHDFADAKRIHDEIKQARKDIDWSQVDVHDVEQDET
jgi:hypothetical protein